METTELKTAVVYARYSSHRQGEQSIEGQLAAAYKYARDNNLRIIHEYIDRAMTGRNDNREQFQEMLKDTSKKQFSVIIVWKIDRFGRNREEIAFNKHKCKKNGVKVVYVAENVPDSPEGVILESVLEGMAEYYSLQLSQNIRRGNRASAEKCQSTGGNRPLGYKTDPVTKKFVIDPDTAPTVRKIYDMYAKGKKLTLVDLAIGILEIYRTAPQRFYLGSIERDPCLVYLVYKIIMPCLSVFGNGFRAFSSIAHNNSVFDVYLIILAQTFYKINTYLQISDMSSTILNFTLYFFVIKSVSSRV